MEDGILFNQSKYNKEMLKKFGLEDSKPMKTPMSSNIKLTKDEECESVDSTNYRGMIGSLLYITTSRPDIMFRVYLCARFQEAPKTSYLEAVKIIFRYIKGTMHLGLWYPKGTGIETVVYADSDHAGDYVDRKSTSAEYVSAGKACQQALWMKQALIDYDVRLDDVPIMCDNKGAIDLSKNLVQHSREMNLEDELRYTKSYIPTIFDENYIPDILKSIIRNLECRNYGEKSHKSIIDPWRNTHSLPYSPPLSPNNSLPKSPTTSPSFDTTPLPPSPNLSNPTFSSLHPQTPTPNHSENRLHELLHLSNLLDITIQNAIELTNRSPPSSPFTHPPCLDQVNFHSDFCHCCLGTRKIFNILKDDLNRIKSLIIGPSTLFSSSITTNSP
ncbi:hypothetical protein Tco_1280731 [Tanacetum coccineum]